MSKSTYQTPLSATSSAKQPAVKTNYSQHHQRHHRKFKWWFTTDAQRPKQIKLLWTGTSSWMHPVNKWGNKVKIQNYFSVDLLLNSPPKAFPASSTPPNTHYTNPCLHVRDVESCSPGALPSWCERPRLQSTMYFCGGERHFQLNEAMYCLIHLL